MHSRTRTEAGLRLNINVGIQYRNPGSAATLPADQQFHGGRSYSEDLARAGMALGRHGANGRTDAALASRTIQEELARLKTTLGADRYDRGHFTLAAVLFEQMSMSSELQGFLTLPAYDYI